MNLEKKGLGIEGMQEIRHSMELKNGGMHEFTFPHYPHLKPVKKLLAFSSVHFLNRRWITVASSPYSEVIYLMSDTFRNALLLASVSIGIVIIATLVLLRINKARPPHRSATSGRRRCWSPQEAGDDINGVPHYLAMIDSAFHHRRKPETVRPLRPEEGGRHRQALLPGLPEHERMFYLDIVEECFRKGQIVTGGPRVDIHGSPTSSTSAPSLIDSKGGWTTWSSAVD
jgi:hypothetical protein